MNEDVKRLLREIPSVDEILNSSVFLEFSPSLQVTDAVRTTLERLRKNIIEEHVKKIPSMRELVYLVMKEDEVLNTNNLQKVINGTGIILHTNLGRAPLSREAIAAINETASSYSNLEYDLTYGKRSSRHALVEDYLKDLTGAEAAMVVNNNAAAVLLALSAVANGKEVIVSRGELVEIGGSFRIPDVMLQSGCTLVEVGTTNKTYSKDYINAISENAGALLRVHTSNFTIIGFTSKPDLSELAKIADDNNLPLIEDLGSGALMKLDRYKIYGVKTVKDSVNAGVDIITFSGDKLLGGPQAGIIVGRKSLIDKMKAHPLARAVRLDKLCFAALEATLRLYKTPKTAVERIPTLNMLTVSDYELHNKAKKLCEMLSNCFDDAIISVIKTYRQAGGGSMPEENISSYGVNIMKGYLPVSYIEEHFRKHRTPIIGRIEDAYFILDVSTISETEFKEIKNAFLRLGEI